MISVFIGTGLRLATVLQQVSLNHFRCKTQRQHLSPPTRAANLRFSCVMTGRTLSAQPAEAVSICSWLRMAPWHSVESSSIFLSCDCKRSAYQLTRCPNTAVSNSALRPKKRNTIRPVWTLKCKNVPFN